MEVSSPQARQYQQSHGPIRKIVYGRFCKVSPSCRRGRAGISDKSFANPGAGPAVQSGPRGPSTETPLVPVPLFGEFVADVRRSECFEGLKPANWRRISSALSNQLLPAFGDMPPDRIGRQDVMARLDRYGMIAPGGDNRALDTLQQILGHAKRPGHPETNPAGGVRRNPQRRFNRFPSRGETLGLHAELDHLVAEGPARAVKAPSSVCSTLRDAA